MFYWFEKSKNFYYSPFIATTVNTLQSHGFKFCEKPENLLWKKMHVLFAPMTMYNLHSLIKSKHGAIKCEKMDKHYFDWYKMLQKCSSMFIHEAKQRFTYKDLKKYWIFINYKMTSYLHY